MQRVEVVDAFLVVVVQHGQETNHNAGERQRVEDRVEQFDVDAAEASADTVQEDRWNKHRIFKS